MFIVTISHEAMLICCPTYCLNYVVIECIYNIDDIIVTTLKGATHCTLCAYIKVTNMRLIKIWSSNDIESIRDIDSIDVMNLLGLYQTSDEHYPKTTASHY